MPTIKAGSGVVTHVNVFTTTPGQQQALLDSLAETVAAARTVPGWLSASIHRGLDGTRVLNYVQFESDEAAQAVLRKLAQGGFLQRNVALGSVAPGQYEVVHSASAEPPATDSALALEPEMTYVVHTTQPLEPTAGSPLGARQYWQVSEATLAGPRIKASLAATGGDWMQMSDDGFWRPDVRLQFVTDDGAVVLMSYTGLVEQSEAFEDAADADRPTDWGDQYMRLAVRFDTGAERYRWLNTSLFVAAGRLLGSGRIEYRIHRVV